MEHFNQKIDKVYQLVGHIRDTVNSHKKDNSEGNREREMRNLLELRKLHRQIYQDIEFERKKSQIENDKLDKETIFLECLDYQKNQLASNIKLFRQLKIQKFNQVKENYLKDLQDKDYLNDKTQILQKLEQELQVRKNKKQKYIDYQNELEEMTKDFQVKEKQYFQELPNHLKKLQNELVPILDVFKISLANLPSQQQFILQLPQPLMTIYERFQRYEEQIQDDTCQIKLEISQHTQNSDSQSLYSIYPQEIKIHFLEPQDLKKNKTLGMIYEYLNTNHQEFFKDIYPTIFQIKYFPMMNKVVVTIDRKNKLLTEEIVCGLVQGDPGEPLFQHPSNEDESNINNKYLYFRWLQDFANRPATSLTPQQLIQKIHQKILHHLQLKLQLEKLKNSELPQPMPSSRIEIDLAGVKLRYFNKISQSQLVEDIPFWFKNFESETLDQIQLNQRDLSIQIERQQTVPNSLLLNDNLLKNYFQENYCYENNPEHMNEIYKIIFEKEKQTFELALIIPQRYPYQEVKFQLLKQDILTKRAWYQIAQQLKQNESKMIEGFEGLILSHQIQRVIEKILISSEELKKKNRLYLK